MNEELQRQFEDPNWWIDKCLNDLYFLCRVILQTLEDPTNGFKDLYYPTHKRICNFIERYAHEGQKLLILTPRGWIKSYIITVGWTIQRLLRNFAEGKREHEIISNATIGNAKEFLEKIKYNFQYNDTLRGLFREFIPDSLENNAGKWTLDEFQLMGNRVETGSVEGNLVSRHYKIMINDDLVNRDNSVTADQLNKTIDWWRLSQSLLLPNGIEILIGTRWNFDDLYGHIIDTFIKPPKDYHKGVPIVEVHRGNYHLLQMDCWEDPDKETGSTFPILFPEEKLKEIQAQQRDRFNGQYRNDPIAKGRNPFQYEWFRRYHGVELPNTRHTVMLIDPSGKADVDSDYTGIVVVHLCPDKRGYIEYGIRKLITDRELADYIVWDAIEKRPDVIGIEDNKYNVIVELLELMIPMYIRRGMIPKEHIDYVKMLPYLCHELKYKGRTKPWRIRNLTGFVEQGKLLFPFSGTEQLEDELIRFPSTKRDDIADALAYIFDVMYFPSENDPPKHLILSEREKETQEEREKREFEEIREDNPVMGEIEDSDWYELS